MKPWYFCLLMPFLLFACNGQNGSQKSDKTIFIKANEEKAKKFKDSTISYSAPVKLNYALLDSLDKVEAQFLGNDYTILIEEREKGDNHKQYTGKVQDEKQSSAIFYIKDGIFSGSIVVKGQKYEITKRDEYVIEAINQSAFPLDENPKINMDTSRGSGWIGTDTILNDLCHNIDVLVVYSDDARKAAGGVSNIESKIGLAFSETNTGFKQSGVTYKVNNVSTKEIEFNEPKTSIKTLNWVENNQKIKQLRNRYKADIVVFVAHDFADTVCGRASTISPNSPSEAYAVVNDDCMTGYYSFGHEIGHILGCRHNCEEDPTLRPFKYSHGYSFCPDRGDSWRTIMSYEECGENRLNYWSNPNNTYNGEPMGSMSGNCQSHNAKTINKNASIIANYRNSQFCQTNLCDKYPLLCKFEYIPEIELIRSSEIVINFPRAGIFPVNPICKVVLNCPGCRRSLCPGYGLQIEGLTEKAVIKIVDGQGEVLARNAESSPERKITTGELKSNKNYFLMVVDKEDKPLEEPLELNIQIERLKAAS